MSRRTSRVSRMPDCDFYGHCPVCEQCEGYERDDQTCRACFDPPHGTEPITTTKGKNAGDICEGVEASDPCKEDDDHRMCPKHSDNPREHDDD